MKVHKAENHCLMFAYVSMEGVHTSACCLELTWIIDKILYMPMIGGCDKCRASFRNGQSDIDVRNVPSLEKSIHCHFSLLFVENKIVHLPKNQIPIMSNNVTS